MKTLLYILAAWLGAGAFGTAILLGFSTAVRRSRERSDSARPVRLIRATTRAALPAKCRIRS